MQRYQTDVAIVGGGIAGLVTALELLDHNLDLTLVDTQPRQDRVGWPNRLLAAWPWLAHPSKNAARSPIRLNWHYLTGCDWPNSASKTIGLSAGPGPTSKDAWSRFTGGCATWGCVICQRVFWIERGHHQVGNSVPRYHVLWGTGQGLIDCLLTQLDSHPNRSRLNCLFEHRVTALDSAAGRISGVSGISQQGDFVLAAEQVVVASGGIGGSVERVRNHWPADWGSPPSQMLNGAHPSADGRVHDLVAAQGGRLTHLDAMWNYAAGVHHPRPDFPNHGLSLIPPRSALWLDAHGRRIGPEPLVTGYDTNWLCREVCRQSEPWTWQLLNHKIALREMAISGSEHNPVIRDRSLPGLLRDLLFGNRALVREMVEEFPDVVVADSLPELVDGMNALARGVEILPDGWSVQSINTMIRSVVGHVFTLMRSYDESNICAAGAPTGYGPAVTRQSTIDGLAR